MTYQIIIAGLLALFFINLCLNLKRLRVPHRASSWPGLPPLVSVLIPARDEARNIGACLYSLKKQDYPNFEIVVLDDNSSDATPGIVADLAAGDSRVRSISGQPLAEGWAGKPFACFQLAKAAQGEWLLFVDADTNHSEDMLSGVMSLALKEKPGLLAGFPRQLMPGFWQVAVLPLMYFFVLSWAPLWWLQQARQPRPQVAIGQFLLFQKAAYWAFGGHAAVKSRIIEDVWLGILVTRHGWRHLSVDLSNLVSCRMYESLGDMWEGLVKWTYSVAAISVPALGGIIIVGCMTFIVPFFWLLLGEEVSAAGAVVALQAVMVLIMRYLVDRRFRQSAFSFLLHPIGFTVWMMAAIYGMGRRLGGAGVSWKKRLYKRSSNID